MALDFKEIQAGQKGAVVSQGLLSNFKMLENEIETLKAQIEQMQMYINSGDTGTTVVTDPISVSFTPSMLYVSDSAQASSLSTNVTVMKGAQELNYGVDNFNDIFGVEVLTQSITNEGKTVCTVRAGSVNDKLRITVQTYAHVEYDCDIEFNIIFAGHKYKQSVPLIFMHKEAKDGVGKMVSTIFKRIMTEPSTPYGGSFASPMPEGLTHQGWSDGIPEGTETTWYSYRLFTSDGIDQDESWTHPAVAFDNGDIDIAYSAMEDTPTRSPGDNHPVQNYDFEPELWHDAGTSDDIWMAVSTKSGGQWGAWNIKRIKGEKGEGGQSVVISHVFTRSVNEVTDPPTSGCGSFYNVNPPSTGWSGSNGTKWYDGLPAGNDSVYMSKRLFTNDGAAPQDLEWSTPILMADSDKMDVCYHKKLATGDQPDAPLETAHPVQNDPDGWHDSGTTEDYWMAVSFKNAGVWGKWNISKIKAEDGLPGASGLVLYFDPNIISATEPYSGGGMNTGATYAKLCMYNDGVEVSASKFTAKILTDKSKKFKPNWIYIY